MKIIYMPSVICIGFLKFFALIHKLPKEKFLLLCLTRNLVSGDITASLRNAVYIKLSFLRLKKSSFICIDFSKFFATIHKLSKKKFLLLCLTSNLVSCDITALWLKTYFRKVPFSKNYISLRLICIGFFKYCNHTTNCIQGKILLLLMFDRAIFPWDITMHFEENYMIFGLR